MKNYTFPINYFAHPEDAIKICSRMGWAPEQDSDSFTITYLDTDTPLVEFIFDYFM